MQYGGEVGKKGWIWEELGDMLRMNEIMIHCLKISKNEYKTKNYNLRNNIKRAPFNSILQSPILAIHFHVKRSVNLEILKNVL